LTNAAILALMSRGFSILLIKGSETIGILP
jgi:hypothetical protein